MRARRVGAARCRPRRRVHPDKAFISEMVRNSSRGRPSCAGLHSALAGTSRGLQFQFRELDSLRSSGIETTLLWRRGEDLDVAMGRLDSLKADPAAGRAPRDAMLEAFEGLDRWVPRPVRELLVPWANAGAVTIEQVLLLDATPTDSAIVGRINRRWAIDSPLRRAAFAALAYLEARDVRPSTVHLHGQDHDEKRTSQYIGFEWRYVSDIHWILTECGGDHWLEVPHLTKTAPLIGIQIDVVDRAALTRVRGSS